MYITLWQNISLRLLICDLIKIVAFHHINNYKDILISDKTVLKSNLFYNRIIHCNVKKQSSWQEYEHYYNISTINTEVFQIHFMTLLILWCKMTGAEFVWNNRERVNKIEREIKLKLFKLFTFKVKINVGEKSSFCSL